MLRNTATFYDNNGEIAIRFATLQESEGVSIDIEHNASNSDEVDNNSATTLDAQPTENVNIARANDIDKESQEYSPTLPKFDIHHQEICIRPVELSLLQKEQRKQRKEDGEKAAKKLEKASTRS
mmetsp:Transcript_24254/g.36866  ORF Transcript_24254/g.36866 Transcript_24254/m.36866 type:complete len:124 (-) Transcript_24254:1458-1829(-)